jgi:flavorubredoxin
MKPREIKPGVYYVGIVDWNRRLFDELIPLPHGTSYNSYLVKGSDKTALIDTNDPAMKESYLANLKAANIGKLDYVIAHHAEQDHSGCLPYVVAMFPGIKVVCDAKAKPMLIDLLMLADEDFLVVADGETIDLGGKTLRFITTPWVHWPETMVTYLEQDKILFSCDFFGCHLATTDMYAMPRSGAYHAAKTYYAEIMMPFRGQIKRNLEKLEGLEIEIICPSHGPLLDKPKKIMDAYREWIADEVENTVVIPYVSMHGSTQVMVDRLVADLVARGLKAEPFFMSRTDIGYLASALVQAATVVIATPTVLAGPHPLATYAATLAAALKPKTRFVSIIGSYGWGGKTVEKLAGIIEPLPVEIIEPVLVKGYPREEDLLRVDALAEAIAEKHKSLGI